MSDAYTSQQNNNAQSKNQDGGDLAAQAKEFGRDMKSKAADLSDTVTRAAKDRASELGSAAKDLANDAKGKVQDAVNQQRSSGADYIGSIAQAVNRAAGEFDYDVPQAARYIRAASDQIQSVADTVRERDVRELVGEVQDFARRQPAVFFGGAMLLGFATLRFLKSSAPASGGGASGPSLSPSASSGGAQAS